MTPGDSIESSIDAKRALLAELLSKQPREFVSPVSAAQKRLWMRERIDGVAPSNTLSLCLRLKGPLIFDALSRTVDFVVERHESLRTTFRLQDGDPVQVISPQGRIKLTMADLSSFRED